MFAVRAVLLHVPILHGHCFDICSNYSTKLNFNFDFPGTNVSFNISEMLTFNKDATKLANPITIVYI